MSDRLDELRRQRALLQEHLAWLDAEIARANTAAPSDAKAAAVGSRGAGAPVVPPTPAPAGERVADKSAPTVRSAVGADLSATAGAVRAPSDPLANPAGDRDAEAILAQYTASPGSLHDDVKKGCLLYLALAFALVGIVVAILWFGPRH